jgi:folylpolyglutamate synthase/dihydropteroate synthase
MAESTALRLADELEDAALPTFIIKPAAAELRRLHAKNKRLHQINQSHEMKLSVRGYEIQIDDLRLAHAELHALNGELLEALKQALEECIWPNERLSDVHDKARAAIAKAEGP